MKGLSTLFLDLIINAVLILFGAFVVVGNENALSCLIFSILFVVGYNVSEFFDGDPHLFKRILFLELFGIVAGNSLFIFLFPIFAIAVFFTWTFFQGIFENISNRIRYSE